MPVALGTLEEALAPEPAQPDRTATATRMDRSTAKDWWMAASLPRWNPPRAPGLRRCLPLLALALALLWAGPAAPRPARDPSYAFFYGEAPPIDLLRHFDHVVLEVDHATPADLRALADAGVVTYAYVSIGEISRGRALHRDVPSAWILGHNAAFGSDILDQSQPGWRELLIQRWLLPLWQRHQPAGFFLDTLDSYHAVARTPAARAAQEAGLAATIRALRARFPRARLLLNRGFELLPAVGGLVDGVVAESLVRGHRAGAGFVPVPPADRDWLLARLREARDRYHLPVVAVDYAPASDRALMRDTARRIAALGVIPWVSTPALDIVGVGLVDPLPRRVLALWSSDDQREGAAGPLATCAQLAAQAVVPDVGYAKALRYAAAPLEHLGYAVDYIDAAGPLPRHSLAGRYAGIVSWFSQQLRRPAPYREFLGRALDDGVRVAVLGHPGFDLPRDWLRRLGLQLEASLPRGAVHVAHRDALIGFEAPPRPRLRGFLPLTAVDGPGVRRHLTLQADGALRMDAVFTAPFGGMALDPYVLEEGYQGGQRWLLDPFAFLQEALALPPLPVADVTTEEGRRLLITHIDGDGFASRAEMPQAPYASQVILDRILTAYPVPTTVSVIEGEICGRAGYQDPAGPCRFPALARDQGGEPGLERIARAIFRLPHVEMASHTYSHPFDWARLGCRQVDGSMNGLFERPILQTRDEDPARYLEDALRRDIEGSAAYINGLSPSPDKRVKVLLWSGNALPPEPALRRAREAGLVNLNGGETAPTRLASSLTNVSPLARPVGRELQIYAPITNENVFTDLWHGPFYGFRDVIYTFALTGSPRRLKPMNIYYHFYSGSKLGAMKALQAVYDHALAQRPRPVWASEYALRARDFYRLTMARTLDGGYALRGEGHLRTLRLPRELGWPDRARSRGVTGVWDTPVGRYVGLDGSGRQLLYLTERPPARGARDP